MTIKIVSSATQSDADLCNALDPPTAGVPVGGGRHVDIPTDFAARIAKGEDVPGCTYAKVQPDGTLYVTDTVQAALSDPKVTTTLSPTLATTATALDTQLVTAVVVSDPIVDTVDVVAMKV